MSLPGTGRSEYGPQRIDLILQLGHTSAVVQNHICDPSAILVAGLRSNPGLGFGATEPVAGHQSLDLGFMIDIDGDNEIEVLLLAGLDEQGYHMDDNGRRSGSPLKLGGSGPDCRMHNSLQVATRDRIGEDDLGDARPVELPIGEYLGAESLDDCLEPGRARLDHFAGEDIGVNDDRSARR
jgi:hypothetical protein